MDDQYLEYEVDGVSHAAPQDRMDEIETCCESGVAWFDRIDPIREVLGRLKAGGKYAKILIDRTSGEIVFVNHDASRFARTPEQIDLLFHGRKARNAPTLSAA